MDKMKPLTQSEKNYYQYEIRKLKAYIVQLENNLISKKQKLIKLALEYHKRKRLN